MKVINDGFRGVTSPDAARTKFRFVLKKLHYVANDDWFNWELNEDGTESEAAIEAMTALHRGGSCARSTWRTSPGPGGVPGVRSLPRGCMRSTGWC